MPAYTSENKKKVISVKEVGNELAKSKKAGIPIM